VAATPAPSSGTRRPRPVRQLSSRSSASAGARNQAKARREVLPRIEPALLGAQPGERRAHARSLIGGGRRDEGAARGLRRSLQQRRRVPRHDDRTVGVALDGRVRSLAHRDGAAGRSAEAHGDDRDSGLRRRTRRLAHIGLGLERFAIAEHDDRAVAPRLARLEQFGPLPDGARDRAPRLPHHARVEVVEKEGEGATVGRQRGQDVAAAGEGDERGAIARRERAQPTHLLLGAREARGSLVGREHRHRRIDGDHHVDSARAHHVALHPPPRPGEGHGRERGRAAEPRHPPAHVGHEALGREARDEQRIAESRDARGTPPRPCDHERGDDSGKHEREPEQPGLLKVAHPSSGHGRALMAAARATRAG
jgi:hypothetical protein